MKPWIVKTEISPGQVREPWWKTVARKLGTWLNRFLRQPSRGDRGSGEPLPSPSVSSNRGTQSAGPAPISAGEAEALARALLEEGGLPEEWMARVREGAPELLLPVEENGTPWYRVAPEAMGEINPQEEPLFPPPTRVPRSEPPSWQFEQPQKSIPHAASDSTTPWTFRQSVIRNESSAPVPTPRWSQRLKQKLQDVVRNPPGNKSRSKTQMAEKERKKPETPRESVALPPLGRVREISQKIDLQSPRRGYEAPRQNPHDDVSPSPRVEAMRSRSEAGRGLSEPPVAFRRTEPVLNEVDVRLGRSLQQWSEETPALATNPKMWPLFSDNARNPGVPIQKSSPVDQVEFDKKTLPVAPAGADPWGLGSSRWPESKRSDLWPELPEDQPMQAVEGAQLLRGSERLRALDFEQKGGR